MELSIRSSRESLSVMDTAITPATHTHTHTKHTVIMQNNGKNEVQTDYI